MIDKSKFRKTCRGFSIANFNDLYGEGCSIQKSSLATVDAIWIGIDTPIPKRLVPGKGWTDIDIDVGNPMVNCSGRMHLSRDQVAELIPVLQRFVDTGEISSDEVQE